MSSHKKSFARFGMAAKGIVYCLIGILTALAAFGQGGQKTGSTGALNYLVNQPFGQVLLILMGLGLSGYVFWRFYQTFANPKNLDNDFKGYAMRVAYFISGVLYGGLAFYALKLGISGSPSGSSSTGSGLISGSSGNTIVLFVGIGIAIKAIYDLYRAYSGKFREEVEEVGMGLKKQKLLLNSGKFGHTARGIVLGLMAFLTIRSGLNYGGDISTQTDAFSYIQNEFGSLALGLVAIGLIGYGVYMLIKAKYPSIVVR